MGFITDNFLLQSETARHLYKKYASGQPILDYHSHLSPKDLAENRRFGDLFEIWLEGDHYKWRAMRANGIPEKYCTGDATPYEKFMAWAATVPNTLRNPLYHWVHLELLRYFGIDELLDVTSAPKIWKRANQELLTGTHTTQGILARFDVKAVCTSDDPVDSLEYHRQIQSLGSPTAVFPTFRPDRALRTGNPSAFNKWTDKLAQRARVPVKNLAGFLDALRERHRYFHELGCRLSDHGLEYCPAKPCTEEEAAAIFAKVRAGTEASPLESEKLASYLMVFFAGLDAERGWTKQLHLGAYRNVNRRMLAAAGYDAGFDSIGDFPQVRALGTFLDRLDSAQALPKLIVYNANPSDNYTFATMIGNFQDGSLAGKIQFGSSWWFLDHKDGIEQQLNALSNCGLLSAFIGMLTDSRSFMSYPRHEYFRRVLCNLLGQEIEAKQLPEDEGLVGKLISRICYDNAVKYLGLPFAETSGKAEAVGVSAGRDGAARKDGHGRQPRN